MITGKKVAVVTGANRGIGFEICRQLLKKDFHVVLTSRDIPKGMEAVKSLGSTSVAYRQLDVTNEGSMDRFERFMRREMGRLDILINNAAVMLDKPRSAKIPSVFEADLDTIRETMETNVYGPLALCQLLVPLMRENSYGRIVNISSAWGQMHEMEGGYPAYRLSKTALNALTKILAEELKGSGILVNAMCPGSSKNGMVSSRVAERSVQEDAENAIWLAMLPEGGPTGSLFRDRKPIQW